MFGFEPYILFSLFIVIIAGLAISYFAFDYFEITIIAFVISAMIAGAFYDNAPVWINEEIEPGFGSYLRGLMLLFSGVMGLVHFFKKARIHKFKIPLHIITLIIFVVFSLASTTYSIDTRNTFVRSSLLTLVLFFVIGLNSWLDSEEKFNRLLNTIFYIIVVFLLLNLVSMFAIPARTWWWKTPSRFLGLTSHPNGLGGFCAVSLPIILWRLYSERYHKKHITYAALFLNLLILLATGSRTSIIMVTIITIIWLISFKDWTKLAIITLFAFTGIIILSQIGISSLSRSKGSKITDLTEREFIWKGAAAFIKEKPIIGYGYAVEGKIFADQLLFDMEEQFFNANAQQPLHNGYLSIFIGGGIIGLSLWFLAIIFSLYNLYKSEFSVFKIFSITSIIALMVSNMVETAVTGYLSSTDIFFWIAWVVGGKIWIVSDNNSHNNIKTSENSIERYEN